MELRNKKIVITGGTSGIGLQLVKSLSKQNQIIVIGRNETKLAALRDEFKVFTYQADLANLKSVELAASRLVIEHKQINLLINNAAIQYTPSFVADDFLYENIEREITTNFTAVCCLTSLLLPALLHHESAAILNVNSGLGLVPKTSSAIYCATKGALNLFSQSLRHQLEDTNIQVLQALMPLVDTNMTQGRGEGKMSVNEAVSCLIKGIERNIQNNDIGKVRILRWLMRLSPQAAQKLMKRA